MKRNVLIINGATRKKGNTDVVVEKIKNGIENYDSTLKIITLRDKTVYGCCGCLTCIDHTACSINDDMSDIRSDISNSSIIVFASPLYWWGVTGIMKNFIDRLFFYYYPLNKKYIAGKKAIVVTTMQEDNVNTTAGMLIEFYTRLFDRLSLSLIKMYFFKGLMDRKAVLDKPDDLSKAESIGKKIMEVL